MPRVVAVGGGTGLSTLLRGLKKLPCQVTAIVTVADDGGSSGRLRRDMGILPPGDIRNCLLALAEAEPEMRQLFNHRFSRGEFEGHNFGNLFLAAMTEMTGDFQLAVRTMSRILAVKGKVLPATLEDVVLEASLEDGRVIRGEHLIPQAKGKIRDVRLIPPDAPALEEALTEIESADIIILGPGSLYTSIIPNLLVKGIAGAIASSKALKFYVVNLMTQPGETDGYSAADHVRAILKVGGPELIETVVVNVGRVPPEVEQRYVEEGRYLVDPSLDAIRELGLSVIAGDFGAGGELARHDPDKLAGVILSTWEEVHRRGEKGSHVLPIG
ncbi:MAG: YvcK family protein [Firmicutes bacterium]|nr:YvcK family protein [Candidatus Fermentithermobacillaceae bacterium]